MTASTPALSLNIQVRCLAFQQKEHAPARRCCKPRASYRSPAPVCALAARTTVCTLRLKLRPRFGYCRNNPPNSTSAYTRRLTFSSNLGSACSSSGYDAGSSLSRVAGKQTTIAHDASIYSPRSALSSLSGAASCPVPSGCQAIVELFSLAAGRSRCKRLRRALLCDLRAAPRHGTARVAHCFLCQSSSTLSSLSSIQKSSPNQAVLIAQISSQ
ncbi:hypothetical protein K491DRAFT_203026 [Lophiostoma macrostomum CBS 122681]|uniref:Uncharacterized protein n=1 Tax=Lophiostoma macrostomum CBS 122681 TaxID=1314788 RepID=A0A6A6TGQ7_9PLEO|nr:hypothetical protein K491DRAFT_203026 [Lophiostoma macrostomum CBS 122681]